jgi:hypothetical protein
MIKSTEKTTDIVFPPDVIAPKHDPAARRNAQRIVSAIGRQFIFAGGTAGGGLFGFVSLLIG